MNLERYALNEKKRFFWETILRYIKLDIFEMSKIES